MAVVLSVLTLVAAAYAATRYAGRTSQHAPISLTVTSSSIRQIRFSIFVKCPSGHKWRVDASRFPAIKISHGTFLQKFAARHAKATATIKGTVGAKRVRGSVFFRIYEKPEQHYCSGTAKFDLRR